MHIQAHAHRRKSTADVASFPFSQGYISLHRRCWLKPRFINQLNETLTRFIRFYLLRKLSHMYWSEDVSYIKTWALQVKWFVLTKLRSVWAYLCVVLQGTLVVCRRKERKGVSDEENSEMDAEPSTSEEEVPGSLNITDEMKRMLNQL